MAKTQIGIIFISLSSIILIYLIASIKPKNHLQRNIKKNDLIQRRKKNKNYQDTYYITEKDKNGNPTLRQRLIYGNIKIPAIMFLMIRIFITFTLAGFTATRASWYLSCVMGWVGWILVGAFLNHRIEKRFKDFDKDYPSYIQTMVSLLKSGMATMVAFEEAASELENDSLLKKEVKKVSDGLRAGTPEDIAIGRFACTIDHPEVELFVQAVLSGKKLGGSLSETLDRISKKARKKQIFRQNAKSAIGQQRVSMYLVMGILISIIVFIGWKSPELMAGLIEKSIIIEVGISLNIFSFYLMKKTSKIKL